MIHATQGEFGAAEQGIRQGGNLVCGFYLTVIHSVSRLDVAFHALAAFALRPRSSSSLGSSKVVPSKVVLEGELNNPRVGYGGRNYSKAWVIQIALSTDASRGTTSSKIRAWFAKLWSVRKVEKLSSELQAGALGNREVPLDRDVEVELARTAQDAHTAVAKASAIPNYRRRSERREIEIAVQPTGERS